MKGTKSYAEVLLLFCNLWFDQVKNNQQRQADSLPSLYTNRFNDNRSRKGLGRVTRTSLIEQEGKPYSGAGCLRGVFVISVINTIEIMKSSKKVRSRDRTFQLPIFSEICFSSASSSDKSFQIMKRKNSSAAKSSESLESSRIRAFNGTGGFSGAIFSKKATKTYWKKRYRNRSMH